MGRVEGDVIKDENSEYFKMVKVQWWVPVKKRSNFNEWHLYEDYQNGKWKCNLASPEQWLNISTILFFFMLEKIQQKKVKLIFLLLMLLELKLISTLLMPQPLYEECWWHWLNYICNFLMFFCIIVFIRLSF